MKSNQELYRERMDRMTKAITLGMPDRVPTMAMIDAWAGTHRNGSMARLSTNKLYSNKLILETARSFPELDMIEVSMAVPETVGGSILCPVKLAGRELPEGSLWQVDEQERMTVADYDRILKMGWKAWRTEYRKKHLRWGGYETFKLALGGMIASKRCVKAGIPEFSSVFVSLPLDPLAGGRSLSKFMSDLYRSPDKIQAVMDVMCADIIKETKDLIKMTKPYSVFVGVARGACSFLSPKLWNRFVWPYVVQTAEAVAATGTFVNLHFDGDWNRELERFKELPRGKCIWASDGGTDLYKLKAALDGHMCIKGAIPAGLMAMGTPDEVYAHCTQVLRDIGPRGFILSPACSTPHNTPEANFRAMISAASGQ